MAFEYIKALHIIFVVTWFAGLFYVVRLFIYQTEALERPEAERAILKPQLDLMTRRLWTIITWPSAILTLILGIAILFYRPAYLQMPFMHAKLGFVFLLYAYQLGCQRIYRSLQQGKPVWNSMRLRLWNEVATLLLFAIVFLIVLKNLVNMFWGMLGLVGLAVLLMLATKWYKKRRERN
ncbi:CopD family protein [Cyclobacterium xiamenense]|uniref:CopD family protein n=1 Tax=Cyclobacterium xiamenense TaxID=1297121 RepID=UPI0012B87414|nr:CopD family protein [Cyclobacterium xiamenense]